MQYHRSYACCRRSRRPLARRNPPSQRDPGPTPGLVCLSLPTHAHKTLHAWSRCQTALDDLSHFLQRAGLCSGNSSFSISVRHASCLLCFALCSISILKSPTRLESRPFVYTATEYFDDHHQRLASCLARPVSTTVTHYHSWNDFFDDRTPIRLLF